MTYSLATYGSMIADRVRMDAYREALRRVVRPGSVVVDLGAGPGIMSFIAAQLGASMVHAIDPSPTLEMARAIARANGFQDRIRFYEARSDAVTLPDRVDVVVADMRGTLPAHNGHFKAMADARERFLKPGGVLIPQRDTLQVALAEAPKEYGEIFGKWVFDGLDLSPARQAIANTMTGRALEPGQLVSAPAPWAAVDYRTVTETALSGTATLAVTRPGTAHALSVWFDAELVEGVGFSTGPGNPKSVYGMPFFPLVQPVVVEPGDVAEVEIRADLVRNDYVWSWNTHVRTTGGAVKAAFRQSTFFAAPLPKELLRKRADAFKPQLGHQGTVDRAILDRFGAGRSLREIATEIAALHPKDFPDWQSALERVASLSARYSE